MTPSPIPLWKTRKVPDVPGANGGTRRPLLSLVVASYLDADERRAASLACLIYSVKAQTYRPCEVVVVHDGPVRTDAGRAVWEQFADDPWCRMIETPARKNTFGHSWRSLGIAAATGDFVGVTNDDNYYCPTYTEVMLSALLTQQADLAYCDMVHSHRGWKPIKSELKRGFVDAGNWVARAALAKSTPWTDVTFAGDWTYVNAMKSKAKKVVKVDGCFFVHN